MFKNLKTLEDWLNENKSIFGEDAIKEVITICPVHHEKLLVTQAYFAKYLDFILEQKALDIELKYPYSISPEYHFLKISFHIP